VDFIRGRRRLEIEQRLDVAAHGILLSTGAAPAPFTQRTIGSLEILHLRPDLVIQ
jgi:hypothetical protein